MPSEKSSREWEGRSPDKTIKRTFQNTQRSSTREKERWVIENPIRIEIRNTKGREICV